MNRDPIREEAIDWAIRVADPAFADWEGLTLWLEADRAHVAAFEAVTAAGEDADAVLRSAPRPAVAAPGRRFARAGMAGGLIAAAIVGAIGWQTLRPRTEPYSVQTRAGETRAITLDGAAIALNGDTRLRLDRRDPRRATLDRGEALFDVRHDTAHPFRLTIGNATIEDVGTRFDVTRDGDMLRVAVAEGAIIFNPDREAVRVSAGEVLRDGAGATALTLAQTDPAGVGGWRSGRLAYRGTPLSIVAADLSRSLGVPIAASPDVAARPFTGVLATGGDKARLIADLGPLLDVRVERQQGRWLLTTKARARS